MTGLGQRLTTAQVSEGVFTHFANVSLTRNYFYMATPKVASSSLLMTLQRLELDDATFLHSPISNVHNRGVSPLLTPQQAGDFWRSMETRFFKFCFVRNPFDRAISAYLDKVLPPEGGLGPHMASLLGGVQGEITFELFLEAVALERPTQMDPHYAVQYHQTGQAFIDYDFVGRFEALDAALTTIGERIGASLTDHSARIDHHWTGEKDYDRFLTPRALDLMRSIYRLDFETFGYSMDV
ncbi:hypothetical protein BH10PSE4_BH10PSE4_08530 [soil metagenome]